MVQKDKRPNLTNGEIEKTSNNPLEEVREHPL